MARKPTDEVQLKLRFEERLRRRLERAAESNNRSMNAEIIHRLEESFQRVDTAKLIQETATATAVRVHEMHFGPGEPSTPTDTDETVMAVGSLRTAGLRRDRAKAEPAKPSDPKKEDETP
jgi:hypothetical protein